MSSHTLAPHGESWDGGRIKRFEQDLDEFGLKFEGNRRRAPLELFADESKRGKFFALMEHASETLTG